ncbi:hypothetical protein ACQP2F_11285 [Actinoplanes sp. CA-030573]|uniref:hypothetical protein n=1 Tax=Actinoplanes sp. CA-030573 TaxID=3239898 RepID=UPI003D8B4E46
MTLSEAPRPPRVPVGPEAVLWPDSLERALIDATAPGGAARLGHVPVLGRLGQLPDDRRGPALRDEASAAAMPPGAAGRIDAEAVAEWLVRRYPGPSYPAVLLGSPHGGAAHLAAALGAAWLPTAFTVRMRWPDGLAGDWAEAGEHGAGPARRILAANPGLAVRQVHDPVLDGPICGATVTFHLRWRRLPAAYARFLRTRLAPGGMSLVLRDLRSWPVEQLGPGHSLQVGSPVAGLSAADYDVERPTFRKISRGLGIRRWSRPDRDLPPRYAERGGEPALEPELRRIADEAGHRACRVLYSAPAALSACVADLCREHLRGAGGPGDACVVETGRLLDPYGALAHGLVPYWCESAARPAVTAAEWWLAGGDPFERLAVLPEPPGAGGDTHAGLAQWRSVAGFARHVGRVDRLAAGRYPRLPLARANAARVVTELGERGPAIPPMTATQVVAGLERHGALLGLYVG